MKFIEHTRNGDEERTIVWADHYPSCETCRNVDLEKPATFANTCAQGAPLLMEEISKRQAPVARQKSAENKKWAQERKTFVTERPSKSLVAAATKYK